MREGEGERASVELSGLGHALVIVSIFDEVGGVAT